MYIFYAVATILILDLFMYFHASYRLKKLKKHYPDFYVIGYKNSYLFLGYKSDSSVSPVGLVPMIRARFYDYLNVPSFGSKFNLDIKPVFSLIGSDMYKVVSK